MDYEVDCKVDLPAGSSGTWRIEHFNVSPADSEFTKIRATLKGPREFVPPGRYTRLMRGSTVVMSDTPTEVYDHLDAILHADGRCLVAGLGLGMVTSAMLKKPNVTHVTVIEKSPDVIALVGPRLGARHGDRLTIVQSDVFDWAPPRGERWSVAWFDIWDNICADNLEEMDRLKKKFARRASWRSCWGEYETRRACRRW